jgi:diketogulonate reductase-like aldo/keto reductase
MIDTADLYKNEQVISNYIAKNGIDRAKIWITTKVPYFTMLKGEQEIRNSIESSIAKFGYIDLHLIHAWNENAVLTWKILREYQASGAIRNIGISNFNYERLIKFIDDIGLTESQYIYCNQIEYNPFLNRKELVEFCQTNNIKIIAYGSLYKFNLQIEQIAVNHSKTVYQILLKWAQQNGVIVIPMSQNSEHITENIDLDFKLNFDEMEIMNNLNENYTRFQKHL